MGPLEEESNAMNMYIVIAVVFATITVIAHLCNKHMCEDSDARTHDAMVAMRRVQRKAEVDALMHHLNTMR
jgi:hypothetical protein